MISYVKSGGKNVYIETKSKMNVGRMVRGRSKDTKLDLHKMNRSRDLMYIMGNIVNNIGFMLRTC